MKMVEIKLRSATAEIEKMLARKERAEKALQKAEAKATKLGADWTSNEAYRAWMDTVETKNGWIVNKSDIEKNGAWFDLIGARRELDEITDRLENAMKRMEKAQTEVESYRAQVKATMDAKAYEALMTAEFAAEQKEWAKDGINLEGRYYGSTPTGKRFWIEGNNGFTERSRHCFTLTIDRKTIFTSGEFWRCYATIKKA